MHPCEEKKDGCKELFTLPRMYSNAFLVQMLYVHRTHDMFTHNFMHHVMFQIKCYKHGYFFPHQQFYNIDKSSRTVLPPGSFHNRAPQISFVYCFVFNCKFKKKINVSIIIQPFSKYPNKIKLLCSTCKQQWC